MTNRNLKLSFLGLLTVLYNFFFWEEKLGLNLFIFSFLLLASMLWLNLGGFRHKFVWVSCIFTFVAASMVLLHNSLISKIAFFGSLAICTAFIHQNRLQSVFYALAYIVESFAFTLGKLLIFPLESQQYLIVKSGRFRFFIRYFRLAFIPLIVFSLFFLIFLGANPIFADMNYQLGNIIAEQLEIFFDNISIPRVVFLLAGFVLISVCIFNWALEKYAILEKRQSDSIQRTRNNNKNTGRLIQMLALKNEYKAGLILLVMVNILLLVVNYLDIRFFWFGFDYQKAGNLAERLHEGTYLLILSILLSMAVLLYFFRGNINFYSQSGLLNQLAFIWIFQNCIVVISVIFRTYYYIHEHGLAYKRIGVLIFLCLTVFGLTSLYIKIKNKKSTYYLIKVNSWASYVMLILMSLVNWDVLIVDFNFKNYTIDEKIDVDFLLTRSDRTLHLLDRYKHKLDLKKPVLQSSDYVIFKDTYLPEEFIENRIGQFMRKQKTYTWLSWNYADYQTFHYLKKRRYPKTPKSQKE